MVRTDKNSPDADLLRLYQNGKEEAFLTLYHKYKTPILNYIYRSCQDRSLAEDLTQEVFLRVYRGAKNYRPQGKVSSWIYTIASHVLWKRMKKERRFVRFVSQKDYPDQRNHIVESTKDNRVQDPLELFEKKQVQEALRREVASLPFKQRQAVILSVYQQLSYQDIGQILEVTEGAVKVMIHRAKKVLKKRLGPVFF